MYTACFSHTLMSHPLWQRSLQTSVTPYNYAIRSHFAVTPAVDNVRCTFQSHLAVTPTLCKVHCRLLSHLQSYLLSTRCTVHFGHTLQSHLFWIGNYTIQLHLLSTRCAIHFSHTLKSHPFWQGTLHNFVTPYSYAHSKKVTTHFSHTCSQQGAHCTLHMPICIWRTHLE